MSRWIGNDKVSGWLFNKEGFPKVNTPVKVVEKAWGKEEILCHHDTYVFKRITINKGHRTSLQKHLLKHETIYIESGEIAFYHDKWDETAKEYIDTLTVMKAGDFVIVNPGEIHRMTANEDSVTLEAQTNHLMDVVRLEDDYNREGTTAP